MRADRAGLFVVSALTILAVAIHGYHPYAEDGGLYLAGIKRVLHPDLYPYWSGFTTAHLRFSLFAPIVASLVRASHLSLMVIMLVLYAVTIWATLFAAWQIAIRCFPRMECSWGRDPFCPAAHGASGGDLTDADGILTFPHAAFPRRAACLRSPPPTTSCATSGSASASRPATS